MSKRTRKPDPTARPQHLLLEGFGGSHPGAVSIQGVAYQYATCHCPGDGLAALVYLRQYGDTRDPRQVSLTADGRYDCTCEDYVYREKAEKGETCKHIDGLVELGILPRAACEPHDDDDLTAYVPADAADFALECGLTFDDLETTWGVRDRG